MIQGINDDGFSNRLGGGRGKQHHVSCGEYYNKLFTNIIWLYVNSFLITVRRLGFWGWRCRVGVWMVGFMYTDLTENNLNMTL